METNEQNKPNKPDQTPKLQHLMDVDKQVSLEQVKPDWITDAQWKANPNIYHWEQSQKAKQLHEQSANPLTREEKIEQARRNRIQLGEDPKLTKMIAALEQLKEQFPRQVKRTQARIDRLNLMLEELETIEQRSKN